MLLLAHQLVADAAVITTSLKCHVYVNFIVLQSSAYKQCVLSYCCSMLQKYTSNIAEYLKYD